MKKYFLVVTAIICCAVFSVTASNLQAIPTGNYIVKSEPRTVKVYKIELSRSGLIVRSQLYGTFDEDNMTISLKGTTEKVYKNTDTGHGRENYSYKAGSYYYFN